MIECPNCHELNESQLDFCHKCRTNLLPGVSPKERVKSLATGLLIFVIGSLISWFIANLLLVGSWAYGTRPPEPEPLLYYAGLVLFAVTCFETVRRIKSALRSTPTSLRYLQRAKRHVHIDPSQSITDLIKALEILGEPGRSSTFFEISGFTMPKGVKLCFDAYSIRYEISDKSISPELMTKLKQLLVKALLYILNDPRDEGTDFHNVALRAATYLAQVGDLSAVKPVLDTLRKGWNLDLTLDRAAILAKFGSAAVDALVEAIKTSDWGAKIILTNALGRIGEQKATEPIIELLKDKEWRVRKEASDALGEIGNTRATEALRKLLEVEKKKEVISAAKKAVEKLEGSNL